MASNKNAGKEARASRERLRLYTARQAVHERKLSRRKRDNLIAVIAGLAVITLAVVTQVLFFTAGPGLTPPDASATPTPSPSATAGSNVGDVPAPALAEGRTWAGEIEIGGVSLGIELDGAAAPQAVAAFIQETEQGYFIDKNCHRLTDGGFFVLQCGSLDSKGGADPSFSFGPIENAPADNVYAEGTLAMARVSKDAYSNSRQFFIVYGDTTIPSDVAGGYTVLGRVTSGLDQLKTDITSKGLTPGSSANDGTPIAGTTITRLTLE